MSFVSVTLILFKTQKKNSFYIVSALFHHLITIIVKKEKRTRRNSCLTVVYTLPTLHSISDYILLLTVVSCLRTNFQFFNNHNKNGIEIAILKVARLCTSKWSKKVQSGLYLLSNQQGFFCVWCFSVLKCKT